MPIFIVTANRLNRRKVVPASLPDPNNIIDTVPKNYIFEADEVSDHEMPSTVHDKWYKDAKGLFYWGGGINELRTEPPHLKYSLLPDEPGLEKQTDYKELLLDIPSEWLATNGKGIKIAILDTGFFIDHPDLKYLDSTVTVKDFGGNSNTMDLRGHGTHVLGMLGAKTISNIGIVGLVPEAKFFLYKVIRDGVGFLDFFVKNAIEDAIAESVDLINMSFNVPSKEGSSLHDSIRKAIDKNILLVASSGENDQLIQSSLVFPAQFENVISVGEIDGKFANSLHTSFNNQLDFIMPFLDQRSCWINDSNGLYRNLKGSSMATALVTGVLASAMSFKNKTSNPVDDLISVCHLFNKSSFDDDILKIIKP